MRRFVAFYSAVILLAIALGVWHDSRKSAVAAEAEDIRRKTDAFVRHQELQILYDEIVSLEKMTALVAERCGR